MRPPIAICTYRVRPGEETKFESLIRQHWPTLRRFGLVTEKQSEIFRGRDESGPFYVEVLEWVHGDASDEAEQTPEVMKVWEGMGALVESRDGRPPMEFPQVERLAR
jgi:hypothetical protein